MMAMEVPAEAAVMLALDFIQPFTFCSVQALGSCTSHA